MIKDKTIELLKDYQLSKGGLSVALFLLNIGGVWTRGQSELAHELGISPRQILDNLKDLEARGYLIKEINPRRMNAKIYRLSMNNHDN